ncbi:MAG TPA: TIGR02757 family protein [Deltaproteobacteria bacterium]|nr:TIGR02757 family protein [Deltaproteobacteria bacterium]HCP45268.1 TIGR02757 family protein [Deltaproteobacteria bacterium]
MAPRPTDRPQLRELLVDHQRAFNPAAHIGRDPVQFPHRYTAPEDIEASAFLAASLAFGRVSAFAPIIDDLLRALGPQLATALREGVASPGGRQHVAKAVTRGYRWLQPEELRAMLFAVGEVLHVHGSIEQAFRAGQRQGASDTWQALGYLLETLRGHARQHHPRPIERARALAFLFPSASGTAPCKRQHLFLRWMVRPPKEGVDFGLWTSVHTRSLVIPCDVHIARIAHALGLASKNSASRRVADEITSALREVAPEDPVQFDFALAHLGISGGCRGRRVESVCHDCGLREACRWWGDRG